jgi:hypothetical protein
MTEGFWNFRSFSRILGHNVRNRSLKVSLEMAEAICQIAT